MTRHKLRELPAMTRHNELKVVLLKKMDLKIGSDQGNNLGGDIRKTMVFT